MYHHLAGLAWHRSGLDQPLLHSAPWVDDPLYHLPHLPPLLLWLLLSWRLNLGHSHGLGLLWRLRLGLSRGLDLYLRLDLNLRLDLYLGLCLYLRLCLNLRLCLYLGLGLYLRLLLLLLLRLLGDHRCPVLHARRYDLAVDHPLGDYLSLGVDNPLLDHLTRLVDN